MQTLGNFSTQQLLNITYMGISDDAITHQLIDMANTVVDGHPSLNRLSKKAALLIAESFQNVVRHGSSEAKPNCDFTESDYFNLQVLKDRIFLSSKNLIANENIELLANKIKYVNQLDKAELKALWMQGLGVGELSEKGGAGLGIIEMARKTNTPLRAQFVQVDEHWSRFYLGLELMSKDADPIPQLSMIDVISHHLASMKKQMLFQYQGDFSAEMNPKIVGMLHSNLVDENNINSAAIEELSIMIELIQNISKHGAIVDGSQQGELSIYQMEQGYQVETSNIINNVELTNTVNFIKQLKNSTYQELLELRKQKIKESLSADGNAGLGLIEIAIHSKQNFDYQVRKQNENQSVFTIQIQAA